MALTFEKLSNALTGSERQPTTLNYAASKARALERRNHATRIIRVFWKDVVAAVGVIKGLSPVEILARALNRGIPPHVFSGLVELYAANWMLQRLEDSIDGTIAYEYQD